MLLAFRKVFKCILYNSGTKAWVFLSCSLDFTRGFVMVCASQSTAELAAGRTGILKAPLANLPQDPSLVPLALWWWTGFSSAVQNIAQLLKAQPDRLMVSNQVRGEELSLPSLLLFQST